MSVNAAFKAVPCGDFNGLLWLLIREQNAALLGTDQVLRWRFLVVLEAGSSEHAFLSVAHDVHDVQGLERLRELRSVPQQEPSVG